MGASTLPQRSAWALARAFEAAVRVAGEARGVGPQDRVVPRPGPAPEACRSVVAPGFLDLGRGVHHEGPALHDRLADRPALQHQELALGRAVPELDPSPGAELDGVIRRNLAITDAERRAPEEIQHAIDAEGGR